MKDVLGMRDQGIWRQGTLSALLGYRARDLLPVAKRRDTRRLCVGDCRWI